MNSSELEEWRDVLEKCLKETGCKPEYWSRHEDLFAQMTSDYPVLLVVQEYT